MKKLILITVLLLEGCAWFKKSTPELPPIPATENRVVVDPKSLQPCELLPKFMGKDYTELADHYLTVISLYGQCSLKQLESITVIRKLSNLDKP
jgi:hypothetical protein